MPLRTILSNEFSLSVDPPDEARVTARGSPEQLAAIEAGDIFAVADLRSSNNPGEITQTIAIERERAAANNSLEIVVDPVEITFHIDRRVSRSIEVVAQFIGAPSRGFQRIGHQISPQNVSIIGPQTILEAIPMIKTANIDLTDRNNSFDTTIPLLIPNDLLSFSNIASVEARILIEETSILTTFTPIAITALNLDNLLIIASPLPSGLIRVQAFSSTLDRIDIAQVQLLIDVGDIDAAGSYEIAVQPRVPSGLTVVRYEPRTVDLEITTVQDR